MYNSQYYTCEQIDQRLLQGYLDDYNTQTSQSLTKEQFLTKLGNVFAKENIIDNHAANIGYFVCDTANGTPAKVITAAGYELFPGGSIKVKFTNRNTALSATLNINGKGDKALYYGGKPVSASNSWDNGEVVEIYYDGTSYYANNVEGNFKDGIFDISSYNLTDGQPTKYDTLSEALGTNGNNIPPIFRKGGMQIKYVSTSDNKYVQYRLMTNTFSTAVANWQGVDDEPTAGSDNLVKSGGVANRISDLEIQLNGDRVVNQMSLIGSVTQQRETLYEAKKDISLTLEINLVGAIQAYNATYSTALGIVKNRDEKIYLNYSKNVVDSLQPNSKIVVTNIELQQGDELVLVHRITGILSFTIINNDKKEGIEQEVRKIEPLLLSVNSLENRLNGGISYELEIGTYYPDSNSYNDSDKKRVRTKKDTYVALFKGDVIRLTDYSKAKIRIAWFNGEQRLGYSSWIYEGSFVCPIEGNYRFCIISSPEVVQTTVSDLGDLLVIESTRSFESVRNKVLQINSDDISKIPKLFSSSQESVSSNLAFLNNIAFPNIQLGKKVGIVADLSYVSSDSYSAIIIDCIEGDIFTFYSSHGTLAGWAFVDDNDVIVSIDTTGLNTSGQTTIVAPKNAAKVVIQTKEKRSGIDAKFMCYPTRFLIKRGLNVNTTPAKDTYTKITHNNSLTSRLNLLVFSDIHSDSKVLNDILSVKNKTTNLHDCIFCGDLNYKFSDNKDWWTSSATNNILFVIGNHDVSDDAPGFNWSHRGKDAYDAYIGSNIENWSVVQPLDATESGKCYYYKDYNEQSVRLIVLDSMTYDEDCEAWFTAVLNDALSKALSVIIAEHIPCAKSKSGTNSFCSFGSALYDKKVPTNNKANLVQNFIENGGDFITWIFGHCHVDNLDVLTDYENQTSLIVTTSAIDNGNRDSDIQRLDIEGQRYSATIISVSTSLGYIYINRIGATMTMDGRSRRSIVWDYRNKKVIREC